MDSQLELTDRIVEIASSVQGTGIDLVIGLKEKVYESLNFRVYGDEIKGHEKSIRWKRTADQIFQEGYVYEGKACTDIVIAYLGLAKARGFDTRFVKVYRGFKVHSIAENLINNEWYIFDVASKNSQLQKGQYFKGISINGWSLWKKGQDAWDLGLKEYNDIGKIK